VQVNGCELYLRNVGHNLNEQIQMNKKIGLKEAISIGIGGMVGGGILQSLD